VFQATELSSSVDDPERLRAGRIFEAGNPVEIRDLFRLDEFVVVSTGRWALHAESALSWLRRCRRPGAATRLG
jgi:hypothetical protein